MDIATTTVVLLALTINSDYSIAFTSSIFLLFLIVVAYCVIILVKKHYRNFFGPDFQIDSAELGVGSQKFTFKPNQRDREIAYKIWVELSTRKIGLPIDLENDVISEIYDSWHGFFTTTRELIKDIPVDKVSHESTRQIISMSISVLNRGLRPHLTKWQARFRRWNDSEIARSVSEDIDPQAIQRKYPHYDDLTKDLLVVNQRLITYRNKMRELVLGQSEDESSLPLSDEPTL